MKKKTHVFSSNSGAASMKWILILVVIGGVAFLLYSRNSVMNWYYLSQCENRVSFVRKLQEKYYVANMHYAQDLNELKSGSDTKVPDLAPMCPPVGNDAAYLSYPNESGTYWSLRVTIKGGLENKCFINADKNGMYKEGLCATKKDAEEYNRRQEQQQEQQ
jgi:hypothetical protein